MNNLEVIKNFLKLQHGKTNLRKIPNGNIIYKGRTLQTQNTNIGFALYNYKTIIAFILDNTLYLNTQKYSVTTSKIQSQLNYLATFTDYKIIKYEGEVK